MSKEKGTPNGWHIRLIRKLGDIEVWQLWKGNEPQSSGFSKDQVREWRDEEIAAARKEEEGAT